MEFLIGFGVLALMAVATSLKMMSLRRVVSANEVHIVRSAKKTTSYGNDTANGNTYYEWPSKLPIIGVTKTVMPISNFDVDLKGYEAYDEGRLPFVVDVKAFFRIADSNAAAQAVAHFDELLNQLTAIVQGAVRTVLASHSLEEIMQGRSKFGDAFTAEVRDQLKNWGVEAVKNIELMDIRDHSGANVIKNIMEKKKSHIEMESRTEVAKNMRIAQIAEIDAKKSVDLQKQEAEQAVGLRTIESKRTTLLSQESANQTLKEQERITKEKEMAVLQVEHTRKAEINKSVEIINAEKTKQTSVLLADGVLEQQKRQAEGITVQGQAKADAEKAMQLAPVQAQITLAKEIGENTSYQKYLLDLKNVEAQQAVGIAQAGALTQANVKIIANTGTPSNGMKSVMDLFSSQGGTQLGAMLEGIVQTEQGQALVEKFVGPVVEKPSTKKLSNGASH